jgi:hypothetical protein
MKYYPVILLSLAFIVFDITNAFTCIGDRSSLSFRSSKTILFGSGDLFDSFKKLWNKDDEPDKKDETTTSKTENDDPAGSSLIASIQVRSIKLGGLRLFLMFYLMGMQNTPDKGSWRADQPSTEEYLLEMYYHDATGMISIELMEEEIRITRCGSVPSTAYLMHESVVVQ